MIPALAPTHAADPAALPDPDRPCVIVRYAIDEHGVPQKRAELSQPAVVRRPRTVKEAS